MSNNQNDFDDYVEHPRYGKGPRYTGLNPSPSYKVRFHWHTANPNDVAGLSIMNLLESAGMGKPSETELANDPELSRMIQEDSLEKRIPNTAVVADLEEQSAATYQVTHYFDTRRICRECGRKFIFFAEEQKFWYEVLKIPLDVDCHRCVPCRKKNQQLEKLKERYDTLISKQRTDEETLEMARNAVGLAEAHQFTGKSLARMRVTLRHISNPTVKEGHSFKELMDKINALLAGVVEKKRRAK